MRKCQCQVPPPPTPLHKRSRAKDYISYQLLDITCVLTLYLKLKQSTSKRTDEINLLWYKQVFSALGVRYNRLSRSVTHGRYPDLNMWPLTERAVGKQNLEGSIKWTTAINSWTACKSKSSLLSFEVEYSKPAFSAKIRVCAWESWKREYANKTKF